MIRKPGRKARWLFLQGGGLVCGILLFITVPTLWIAQGWLVGATVLILVVNVAIAFWGQQSAYRTGYWRGRIDLHSEQAAEALRIPWPDHARAEPWSPNPMVSDNDLNVALMLLQAKREGK